MDRITNTLRGGLARPARQSHSTGALPSSDTRHDTSHAMPNSMPASFEQRSQPAANQPLRVAIPPPSSGPTSVTSLDKPLPLAPPRAALSSGDQGRGNVAPPSVDQNRAYAEPRPARYALLESPGILPSISLRRQPAGRRVRLTGQENIPDPYAGIATTHYPVSPSVGQQPGPESKQPIGQNQNGWKKMHLGLGSIRSRGHGPSKTPHAAPVVYTYDPRMVDVLDTIDPEVQTLTSLTNVQNSLFIPNLGRYVNRRPTYSLSRYDWAASRKPGSGAPPEKPQGSPAVERPARVRRAETITSIDSQLSDTRYAVRPDDVSLEGWSKEDLNELNDHVRHMLHSRRAKFKRSMKGFVQYASRPLGFLVTLYATLITLFGLAWVLFLIGWINVGGKQLYVINVIDYVLVALFAIVGDGLAPFRAIDTYRMIHIARYHRLTLRLRREHLMPPLQDHNDLPTEMPPPLVKKYTRKSASLLHRINSKFNPFKKGKPDDDVEEPYAEYSVLKHTQQQRLIHHQKKFARSHTFYKPHETETHYAFPWRLLVAIVILLDCHSLLQIALGACTWGIDYHHRPFALTTVILCCSITCNATAGILIMIGDRRTRKRDVLERMDRQELTQEAIEKMQKKREKEGKEKVST